MSYKKKERKMAGTLQSPSHWRETLCQLLPACEGFAPRWHER
jgi:hypothetical protein